MMEVEVEIFATKGVLELCVGEEQQEIDNMVENSLQKATYLGIKSGVFVQRFSALSINGKVDKKLVQKAISRVYFRSMLSRSRADA